MSSPNQPKIGREAEAKLALETTRITPFVSWGLTLGFLLTIGSVPLVQHVLDIQKNLAARRLESARGEAPQTSLWPKSYDFLAELPSMEQLRAVRNPRDAWQLIPSADQFKTHEDALQDDSFLVQWTLPRLQNFGVGIGVGNEQAYCGRELAGHRWLHYRPDVDYVTSRGFLDPALLLVRRRSGEGAEIQPDPVRAIADFQRQLARRGIDLIVMPTPVKTMMHPEALSSRYSFAQGVLQNPSYSRFREILRQKGVKVFDVSDALFAEMRRGKKSQYLQTDTHWTPPAMELAARKLGEWIQKEVELPPQEPVGYTRSQRDVANRGDITEMLRLPENQTWFDLQKVQIHPVSTPDGELWYPSRAADILLLGDSFSNIYSLDGMNWGEAAGLAEQLSFALQRPVDSITNNAGGSHVTRERLARELARGKNRLRGKRLVIWQFAMRDLLIGDWKMLELPSPQRN